MLYIERGIVAACGLNEDGQLGINDADERILPTTVRYLTDK